MGQAERRQSFHLLIVDLNSVINECRYANASYHMIVIRHEIASRPPYLDRCLTLRAGGSRGPALCTECTTPIPAPAAILAASDQRTRDVMASGLFPPQTGDFNEHAPERGAHLYHFAQSICSRQVRMLLDELNVPYTSHHLALPLYEHYEPEYVRINPRAVVPALVIHGCVFTDSANILQYVDDHYGNWNALLLHESEAVKRQCARVDSMPWKRITFGQYPPEEKVKPTFMRQWSLALNKPGERQQKLHELLQKHGSDPELRTVYAAAIGTADIVDTRMVDMDSMRRAFSRTKQFLERLETELLSGPFVTGGWLCSKKFTRADVMWACALHRLEEVGVLQLHLDSMLLCRAYYERLCARPSFKSAITKWDSPCAMGALVTRVACTRVAKCRLL
eukprot:6196767-Pleurochrysis_carterae.AAC.1